MKRLAVAVLAAVLLAGSGVGVASAATPSLGVPLPENDPFYTAPADLPSLPDGAEIRSREITALVIVLPVPAKAYQVLYKSQNAHGAPVAEATTVLVPLTKWAGKGNRPLLSYQVAEDSVSSHCQPSYTLRTGLGAPTAAGTYEISTSLTALAKGYAIAYPDYEGPQSQFGAGMQYSHAILDGARAALHYQPAGLDPRSPVTFWGYSGGGLATTWAAEQQGSYAPELNVVGSAAGGVPADLEEMLRFNNGNIGTGFIMLGLIGISRAYPEVGINDILNDKGKQLFAAHQNDCTIEPIAALLFQHIEEYTNIPDPLTSPKAKQLYALASPGQATPKAPFYNYQALNDELVPPDMADRLLIGYCTDNGDVQRVRLPLNEHISGEFAGLPGALSFLQDRMDGKQTRNDCPSIA